MRYHHRPWASPGSRPPNPSWAGGFVDHNCQAVRWMGHLSQQQLSATSQSIRNGLRASQNMNWTRWSPFEIVAVGGCGGTCAGGKRNARVTGVRDSASSAARPTRKGGGISSSADPLIKARRGTRQRIIKMREIGLSDDERCRSTKKDRAGTERREREEAAQGGVGQDDDSARRRCCCWVVVVVVVMAGQVRKPEQRQHRTHRGRFSEGPVQRRESCCSSNRER
jgi:hypothetical protein